MKADGQRKGAIRLGIMCMGSSFSEWEARCLKNLLALEYVQPTLLIVDNKTHLRSTLGYKMRWLVANLGRFLFTFYSLFISKPRALRRV